MKRVVVVVVVVALALAGSACTWIQPKEGTEDVALVKAHFVQQCQKIGSANALVPHKIIGLKRRKGKVADELIVLAKNEALGMGGDTIVSASKVDQGQQRFDVYRCR